MCKISPMKVRTIAITLMLLVAGLAISCSSAPEAPAAPVPNLSEKEAIGIARSSDPGGKSIYTHGGCWFTEPYDGKSNIYSNFSHTESATFKPSGIWVVTAKSSWNWKNKYPSTDGSGDKTGYTEWPCTYVVNDATGRVTSN